ncbi:LLM class flavin-dependent oxidoreductase [Cohnella massiliensis]|uniref:LLM class flavin-dependent oxidoreductase n=1 Tax=Cohnella massiliensis TaxID=1816691 RepID=UPI0009B9A51C|nr:LLM class flavin-dependent oxidoreductase [Cohnella massiliensis]
MSKKREIKLSAYLVGTGMHASSWRLPAASPGASVDIDYYRALAATAERGKFDMVFLADSLAINEQSHPNILNRFEPLTLIAALAGSTSRIGLVATASTSYVEPFNLARQLLSADRISRGRAGWNIVTTRDLSGNTARNFGAESHYELEHRYRRAEEFVDVVRGLWDSWEDGAFVYDKETGRFFDPSRLHRIRHKGEFFSVEGPLNVARSEQGYPLLVQAGNSDAGQQLSARVAEVVFAIKFNFEDAKEYYDAFKRKVASFGRNPDNVYILQGIAPVIGATDEEAQAKKKRLEALLPDETILGFLADYFKELDFSRFTPETTAAEAGLDTLQAANPDYRKHQPVIARENPTLREIYSLIIGSFSGDHLVGTPEKIADTLEQWFLGGAADGFMLMAPALPEGLDDFVNGVVPILQARGLFRLEYEGSTLREHFSLPVPPNRFSAVRSQP